MADDSYIQCELERDSEKTVAFVPKKFAKVGLTVRLRIERDGEFAWDEGWKVVATYQARSEYELFGGRPPGCFEVE